MAHALDGISCYNTRYIEEQWADYLHDPARVSESWRHCFEQLDGRACAESVLRKLPDDTVAGRVDRSGASGRHYLDSARLQERVDQLVHAYRVRGHLAARLDPLGTVRPEPPELDPATYGLSRDDLKRRCSALMVGGPNYLTVSDLVDRLRAIYCRHIGVQFMHIDNPAVRNWLQQRMESGSMHVALSRDAQLRILTNLTSAVIFEEFVRKKYIGSKTFSLEGAESLIPLLHLTIEKGGRQGIQAIVMGMAHRGRLNVLANIIGKSPLEIFWEFNDPRPALHYGPGDVMYHLGFSSDWMTQSGQPMHLSLCFNPSHLEFVNPVALGRMRAKQDRAGDRDRTRGMVVLIHGDAAFAGEGIVQESLNLGGLNGYTTGGTLHVIVNNQIGFTTSPEEGHSTTYATDVARMLQIPIFHVNGEYPEAVAQVVDWAMDYRAAFGRDVVIDMFCYRRWGHNEGDEPSFTQPSMYRAIERRKSIRDEYLEHLLDLKEVTRDEADRIADERRTELGHQFQQACADQHPPARSPLGSAWHGFVGGSEPGDDPDTAVDSGTLRTLLRRLAEVPRGFHLHTKLARTAERRRAMADGEMPLDWSAAEALAIATLSVEGHPVRLSGEDTARGTFSQRHAVLHDVEDGSCYHIFDGLSSSQAPVEVINSPLCEAGALAFEYGYSLDYPEALVAWEAQYGDFANAAQVIIDQFLAGAEDKWRLLSGIVLLLPHGFEGMGPEHSSVRLERFLSLAAEDNLQITCPSTPAQYFHLLRRQVLRRWRKPLIVLTPKSLLRHPRVVSSLDDLASGHFRRLLYERRDRVAQRVLLCTGKVYYDLLKYREEHQCQDVSIVRVEQLYPLAASHFDKALQCCANGQPVVWVQEEPENMGAWRYWRARFGENIGNHPLKVAARPESASPATGSKARHKREQEELVRRAFDMTTQHEIKEP